MLVKIFKIWNEHMIYAHILMFIIIQGNFPYLSKVIVYIKNFYFYLKSREKRECSHRFVDAPEPSITSTGWTKVRSPELNSGLPHRWQGSNYLEQYHCFAGSTLTGI